MTSNSSKTQTTTEPTTIINIDFSSRNEGKKLEPTHFSCDCETCRESAKASQDWKTGEPLPEAA